jgi:hypothetical protein
MRHDPKAKATPGGAGVAALSVQVALFERYSNGYPVCHDNAGSFAYVGNALLCAGVLQLTVLGSGKRDRFLCSWRCV